MMNSSEGEECGGLSVGHDPTIYPYRIYGYVVYGKQREGPDSVGIMCLTPFP